MLSAVAAPELAPVRARGHTRATAQAGGRTGCRRRRACGVVAVRLGVWGTGTGDEVTIEHRRDRLARHTLALLPRADGGEAARPRRNRRTAARGRQTANRKTSSYSWRCWIATVSKAGRATASTPSMSPT